MRVFPQAGGHRETLIVLDDQQRRIAFTFADHAAGLPVRSYTSTITARPVTLTDDTYVEWSSRFDCDEADEDKAVIAIRDGGRAWPEGAGAAVRPRPARAVASPQRLLVTPRTSFQPCVPIRRIGVAISRNVVAER